MVQGQFHFIFCFKIIVKVKRALYLPHAMILHRAATYLFFWGPLNVLGHSRAGLCAFIDTHSTAWLRPRLCLTGFE